MLRIRTDSVASIPADAAREAGIDIITLYVNRDGRELADAGMDLDAFYADIYDMVDNIPTSSQPSQAALEAVLGDLGEAVDAARGGHDVGPLLGQGKGHGRSQPSTGPGHEHDGVLELQVHQRVPLARRRASESSSTSVAPS